MSESMFAYAIRTRKGNYNERPEFCNAPDCAGKPVGFSLCLKHYSTLKREMARTGKRIPRLPNQGIPVKTTRWKTRCGVAKCHNPHKALGYCASHYQAMNRIRLQNGRIEQARQAAFQTVITHLETIGGHDELIEWINGQA